MKQSDFAEVVKSQFSICEGLLSVKNTEYTKDVDVLHVFDVASSLQGVSQKQALAGMLAKHIVSIFDMCKDGEYSIEKWDEKITDSINYLLLLKAMIVEDELR